MASEKRRFGNANRTTTTAVLFLILSISILAIAVFIILKKPGNTLKPPTPLSGIGSGVTESVVPFTSEADFLEYLQTSDELMSGSGMFGGTQFRRADLTMPTFNSAFDESMQMAPIAGGGSIPDRVSSTNVQYKGIDEPDIVKTDGTHIYTSLSPVYIEPMMMWREGVVMDEKVMPDYYIPPQPQPSTHIVRAFPPNQLGKRSSIQEQGDLLLINNTLLVLGYNKITGYNVSNPALPVSTWDMDFDSRQQLQTARLFGNTLYIVLQSYIDRSSPCPYMPLMRDGGNALVTIRCEDIYHPVAPVPVDVTYTITSINAETGQVTDTVSFVGASGSSIVSMSPNALYVTYTYYKPYADILMQFFDEEGSGLLPPALMTRIEKLKGYELSSSAKMVEIENVINDYQQRIDQDERRRIENEVENRMQDYIKRHGRELETTGIVKISRRDLTVQETGSVPGHPLNQFAIDEYDGVVRVAVTLGGSFFSSRDTSVSDVYTLNDSMRIMGSVKDLGKGERIYAVRFVGKTGYVVTFRETDPFYVIDLSRPNRPQLAGELKIPGYSSYLHPITDTLILGVGKEDQNVKLSLFDVSNPASPREADKYMLDEYWSDILNTHHAFLHDAKHEVFFVPGGQGGYILSYGGNKLTLQKAIDTISAKRALYIDNYLYIIGEQEIVVIDETSWERVGELSI